MLRSSALSRSVSRTGSGTSRICSGLPIPNRLACIVHAHTSRPQGASHQRRHDIRLVVDVTGREAQELEAGTEQPILAAIVFDQAIPVVRTVVLEDEPRRGVVKVRSSVPIFVISQIHLYFGPWQAALDQKPSKPCLHRRFGRGRPRSDALPLSAPEAFN